MKPVLIINPNGSQKTTQDMVGITSRYLPNVMGWTNHKGPKMIVDRDQLYEAANQISEAVFPDASALIVAAFGGIVGLCMGFSLLSGAEQIYFFS